MRSNVTRSMPHRLPIGEGSAGASSGVRDPRAQSASVELVTALVAGSQVLEAEFAAEGVGDDVSDLPVLPGIDEAATVHAWRGQGCRDDREGATA